MKLATPIILESLDLQAAERLLCERALREGGTLVVAARLLGISRHALKRRILKLRIAWPAAEPQSPSP
jgi:DNA-binding NtrC family response regulator